MSLASHQTSSDRFCGVKTCYLDRSLSRAIQENRITQADANLILAFIAERRITANISVKRSQKIASSLVTIRRFVPPYSELTQHTLYSGIDRIQSGISAREKEFSRNTKIDLIAIIKQFSIWLVDNGEIHIPEKKIKAIKSPKKLPVKTASDLLTADEVQALVSACRTSRDRAMIITMYEGGFRVGEIGLMRWGALKIDGTGVVINVTFKTGKPRYIRLVMSKEHLIKWKSDYPEEITEESLVFLNERRQPMTHAAVSRQLGRLSERAGITKHLTPHIFRHSRITHLIQQGVSESVIKLMMWGSIDSKMFINYAHLTGTDIDREIYRLYGIEPAVAQVTGKSLEPRVCPHCHEMNSPVSAYCHLCGQALDEPAQCSADEFAEYILGHRDLIINFLNRHSGKQ